MFDMENNYNVIGQAKKYKDELYYIDDQEDVAYVPLLDEQEKGVFAMRPFVSRTDH